MFQCEEKIVLFDFKHGKMTPFGPRHAEGVLSGYVSVHHASLSRLYHVLHLKSSFPSNFVAHVCHILVIAAFCLALKCSFHINFFLYFFFFFPNSETFFIWASNNLSLFCKKKCSSIENIHRQNRDSISVEDSTLPQKLSLSAALPFLITFLLFSPCLP